MSGGRCPFRLGFLVLLPLSLATGGLTPLDTPESCTGAPQTPAQPPAPVVFKLEKGDHVCIIGNALAARMQHDGWLESYLHGRHPQHNLTVRNLGYSGDEVGGYTENPDPNRRMRSADFGTGDQWLAGNAPIPNPGAIADKSVVLSNRFEKTGTRADVIFAFFGYNESWAGEAGVPKFKADLESFIKHAKAQKYNGKTAPQLVLFSPIAFENHKSPNLPDGLLQNRNLERYTAAMRDVAAANGVRFVDLFHPTQQLFETAKKRLTINGLHLTSEGNRQVAEVIDTELFGTPNGRDLSLIREAVLDKNFHWFHRYRTTDGYSTYGGRAWLKFIGGQTNYEVVQRELENLDIMTANRDKVIWNLAAGRRSPQERKPDDSKLRPFVPVITNKPGKGPGGTHLFLSGADEISRMKIAPGLKVTLFADEKMFPELANPVQMAWDPQGRLWVAVWPTYPHWKPTERMNDKLLIFEDTNGDGKADKMTVFADGLDNPTGFEFYNGGVIIAQAPDLVYLKDTDGDGKADVRERIAHGLDTADTHHTSNSFVVDPGGALYFQEGTFHHSQVETPYGPPQRVANGAVFRYEPRTQKFNVYVTYSFANPHGHVFDKWGQDIVVDGTGAVPYHGPLFSSYLAYPAKHGGTPTVYDTRGIRPCPGMEILSSQHFPPEYQDNLLVANVIGFQGIRRLKLKDVGSSFGADDLEPMLSSSDPNFRPTDLKVGPDGAVYFIDWHNPIIGHMQHNLRDPSRDREHGRIYKVTFEGRPLSQSPRIAGEPIDKLLKLLNHPEDRVRARVRAELGGRKTEEVVTALGKWVETPGEKGTDREHAMLEALWVLQAHNTPDRGMLTRVLSSPDFRVRAAGVRVVAYWRDRLPKPLELLTKAAADEHPRVRLMAVWAASFFTEPEAAEVVFIAQEKPTDRYLDHLIRESMRTLGPIVQKAIEQKRKIEFTTAAGVKYLVKLLTIEQLLAMKRTREVNTELLFRPGIRDEIRRDAVRGLAHDNNLSDLNQILAAIRAHDASEKADESVTFDLFRLLTGRPQLELAGARSDLKRLATEAQRPVTRQLGFVALVAGDGTIEDAWRIASKSVPALQDLVAAMPLLRDPGQRAALYPKVEALLRGLPPALADSVGDTKTVMGQFVRVELPGRQRTLTLAEVEVFADGKNVARAGKARQSSTAHGGSAARGVDGNTNGSYGNGGQTHTQEGTNNPWWEVDLGREYPIEKVVIFNRTDGTLGSRLQNFTLRVLGDRRQTRFEKAGNPAPSGSVSIAVGSASPERIVRRSAMLALASVRGKEADAFKVIAPFVKDAQEREAAVRALLRIPAREWPKDSAPALLAEAMRYIRGLPVADRTRPLALDMMQLGEGLANLLPPDQARAARKELADIGVRVIRVGTLTDQMQFDKDRIAVQAGKPVEFRFENTDIMPHNFVIVAPGRLELVGNSAELQGAQPGAAERDYVPALKQPRSILLASKLLQPRQTQQLPFTAPKEPGIYPYVCTYPGHWRRMHGALYVVADLDEYLADPTAYLAKHPLPVKDELLKFNRPRTEWKLEELAAGVTEMSTHGGRNFANGRQMFTVATCVACHKYAGQGNEFGPDLANLDVKTFTSPTEVLRHVLEPSLKIDDRYATYQFTLVTDKVMSGVIVEEKNGVVKVVENPLANAKPTVLKLEDIATRKKAATSMMPKNLLDKLTKDEILDLIAYVWSKGDPKHAIFQGHHH